MYNIKHSDSCYNDLIRSNEFNKALDIVLNELNIYDNNYIKNIFLKVQNGLNLSLKEKEELRDFLYSDLLSKVSRSNLYKYSSMVQRFISLNDDSKIIEFIPLMSEIFGEDGFEKIRDYIVELSDMTSLILDYGFEKMLIILGGKPKEIYFEKQNFKVDSIGWNEKEVGGLKFKVNHLSDIIEYLDGDLKGEQLFSWNSADRETKKQGKRLPSYQELEAIIETFGVDSFVKKTPGAGISYSNTFQYNGEKSFFWSGESEGQFSNFISFDKHSKFFDTTFGGYKQYLLSVRSIKDLY